jgi:hypothetical protein
MPDALVLAQDIVTIACAAFNAAHFASRCVETQAHRVAAFTLTLVNAAVVLETAFFLALYHAYQWHASLDRFFAPPAWLTARVLLLLAVALITVLILRRSLAGER